MKKLPLFVLIFAVVFIIACQTAEKATPEKKPPVAQGAETGATGDASVDSVGNSLNNVDSIEKDLSTDELGDLDSGLDDIQNI